MIFTRFQRIKKLLAIIWIVALSHSELVQGQQNTRVLSVQGDAGFSGSEVRFFDTEKSSGEIVSVFYSGPPRLIAEQKAEWSHWHKLGSLQEIHFSLTSISDELSSYISTLESVKTLTIESCKLLPGSMLPLRQMHQLSNLEVELTKGWPVDDWSFLSGLTNLESLSIVGEYAGSGIASQFSDLTRLKSLNISLGGQSAENVLLEIAKSKNLKELELSGEFDFSTFTQSLPKDSKLESLTVMSSPITLDDITTLLKSLKALHTLRLSGVSIGGVTELPENKTVRILELNFRKPSNMRFRDLAFIRKFSVIETFTCCNTGMEQFLVKVFSKHTTIEDLILRNSILKLEDIDTLESIANLKSVQTANSHSSVWWRSMQVRLPNIALGRF